MKKYNLKNTPPQCSLGESSDNYSDNRFSRFFDKFFNRLFSHLFSRQFLLFVFTGLLMVISSCSVVNSSIEPPVQSAQSSDEQQEETERIVKTETLPDGTVVVTKEVAEIFEYDEYDVWAKDFAESKKNISENSKNLDNYEVGILKLLLGDDREIVRRGRRTWFRTKISWSGGKRIVTRGKTLLVQFLVKYKGDSKWTVINSIDYRDPANLSISVKINPSGFQTIEIGKDMNFSAEIFKTPSNADADAGGVTWSIGDSSIATVTSSGVVTGVKEGRTTLTATSDVDDNVSASVNIEVEKEKKEIKATLISAVNKLEAGKSTTVTIKIDNIDAKTDSQTIQLHRKSGKNDTFGPVKSSITTANDSYNNTMIKKYKGVFVDKQELKVVLIENNKVKDISDLITITRKKVDLEAEISVVKDELVEDEVTDVTINILNWSSGDGADVKLLRRSGTDDVFGGSVKNFYGGGTHIYRNKMKYTNFQELKVVAIKDGVESDISDLITINRKIEELDFTINKKKAKKDEGYKVILQLKNFTKSSPFGSVQLHRKSGSTNNFGPMSVIIDSSDQIINQVMVPVNDSRYYKLKGVGALKDLVEVEGEIKYQQVIGDPEEYGIKINGSVSQSDFKIDGSPKMPSLNFEIYKISALGDVPTDNVNWSLRIDYQRKDANDSYSSGLDSGGSSWQPNFTADNVFIGGDGVVIASFGADKVIQRSFTIKGNNPSSTSISSYIPTAKTHAGLTLQNNFFMAVLKHESKLKQFNTRGDNIGYPNWGTPYGWGVSQLDRKEGGVSIIERWNWKTNMNGGAEIMQEKYDTYTEDWWEAFSKDNSGVALPTASDAYITNGGSRQSLGLQHIGGKDALTIQAYNGLAHYYTLKANGYKSYYSYKYEELGSNGLPNGKIHPTCWQYEKRTFLSNRWIIHTNKNSYLKKVDDEIK